MKKQRHSFEGNQYYGFLPTDVEGVGLLAELALDMRWSWDHATDELWQRLDADLWKRTHNPWIVLQTVSRDQLKRQLADPVFLDNLNHIRNMRDDASTKASWFQQNYEQAPLKTIAYFSMEYMLSESLPIYAGGLGNVAGDQLKSASDLGIPVTAVGLMYQQGYFRQQIDEYGNQKALFPYNDPGQLPVMPVRLPNGEWLRLKITLAGQTVWLRTWQVQAGRNKLFLLDSNDAANLPVHREITNELYGGGPETRIQQEVILGIGGWKLLEALGIKPEVCHMNEGHAAFLVLERAASLMKETGIVFEEALAATRAGNLFTTHTALAASFDYFSPSFMWQYFGAYAKDELKIDFDELMALGRVYPNNFSESFNMANLAIRGSGAVNAVSRLHSEVSRNLFEYLFPRWPVTEVPIGSVTNGVHMPSWDSEFADDLWTKACGKDRWRGDLQSIETDLSKVTDEALWQMRTDARDRLVNYTRERLADQFAVSGGTPEMIAAVKQVFDPNVLTLGFARRFVAYKRPNLLLYDEERLMRILTNREKPVQLVIAGKAPPYDESGKGLIRQWIEFIRRRNLYKNVVFLSDYDMLLTEHLVQGVDVWFNTPRRPWEACGTSGMKVLVNGGLNLSELDGWWAEAYTPEVGWAIGDTREHGDNPEWDAAEAEALYDLLEKQIIPEFYSRSEKGLPLTWTGRIRKSMALLAPRFSANRAVREYTERFYLPAAKKYRDRIADDGILAKRIIADEHELNAKWNGIRFEKVDHQAAGDGYLFQASIWLNGIEPENISIELYADACKGGQFERIPMRRVSSSPDNNGHMYQVQVNTQRPPADFTARVIANAENISVPLENNLIFWER